MSIFSQGVVRMSEDASNRAARINGKLSEWEKKVAGDSTNAPLRVVEILAANPFITAKGSSARLGVAFTTTQRAIERLQRLGIKLSSNLEVRNGTGFIARKLCSTFLRSLSCSCGTQVPASSGSGGSDYRSARQDQSRDVPPTNPPPRPRPSTNRWAPDGFASHR